MSIAVTWARRSGASEEEEAEAESEYRVSGLRSERYTRRADRQVLVRGLGNPHVTSNFRTGRR